MTFTIEKEDDEESLNLNVCDILNRLPHHVKGAPVFIEHTQVY